MDRRFFNVLVQWVVAASRAKVLIASLSNWSKRVVSDPPAPGVGVPALDYPKAVLARERLGRALAWSRGGSSRGGGRVC